MFAAASGPAGAREMRQHRYLSKPRSESRTSGHATEGGLLPSNQASLRMPPGWAGMVTGNF